MRLIDADKLYPDCMTKDGKLAISQSQLANAPAVSNEYMRGYEAAEREYKRPQGEWIYLNKDEPMTVECPFCHERKCCISNYCDYCGADMRKGGAV